jgi:hypothetical protein
MLLSFGHAGAQPAPGEDVKREGFQVELKKAPPTETAKARLVEAQVDLKTLEADLERKKQELDQAKARLEKARAAAARTAAGAAPKGVTIRIEISGLEGKPEELKALISRLEKELPGKVVILAAPQAAAWRVTNRAVSPGAPVEASGWKIVTPDAKGAKAVPLAVRFPKDDKGAVKPPAKEEARSEALEKKLDGLLKELAELRRELSGLRAKEPPARK